MSTEKEISESPRGIPSWVIILIILFAGWATYYAISYFAVTT